MSTLPTSNSRVIVLGPPGPPGGVSALELGSRSGKIVWTDGAIYGREISNYRVEGRTNHNSTWVVLADRQTAVEPDYTSSGVEINGRRQMNLVNKLSPFAAYQFRIAAYNEIGMGEYSEPSPSYNTRLGHSRMSFFS